MFTFWLNTSSFFLRRHSMRDSNVALFYFLKENLTTRQLYILLFMFAKKAYCFLVFSFILWKYLYNLTEELYFLTFPFFLDYHILNIQNLNFLRFFLEGRIYQVIFANLRSEIVKFCRENLVLKQTWQYTPVYIVWSEITFKDDHDWFTFVWAITSKLIISHCGLSLRWLVDFMQ